MRNETRRYEDTGPLEAGMAVLLLEVTPGRSAQEAFKKPALLASE